MSDVVRTIAITGLIGAAAAGALTLPAMFPAAIADEQPMRVLGSLQAGLFPQTFDTNSLVKYDVTYDDYISTEVERTQTVKKIGFGQTTTVTITTTPSGTYSSDAILSPYIKYPGIEVTKRPVGVLGALEEDGWMPVYKGSVVILLAGDEDV